MKNNVETVQQEQTINDSTETGSQGQTIKGNINSRGEKIYHIPGGKYYDQTNPEEWFFTEEDARAAGYRKSKV
jgi:micrococcal nuclease